MRIGVIAPLLSLALFGCGGDDGSLLTGTSTSVVAVPSAAPVDTNSNAAASDEVMLSSAATTAVPVVPLRGVNISGGEFGSDAPGRMYFDYVYPSKAEIDYYVSKKMKIIRVPFKWERLQPTLKGPLVAADKQALRDVVDYATGKGLTVVLDLHNFGQRFTGTNYDKPVQIGKSPALVATLVDGWTKIATEYKTNDKVWLGLMNEPFTHTAEQWFNVSMALVKGIRANGIPNKVLVPGTAWTGAHSWVSSGNAGYMANFKDPKNNFAFEVHQYLDNDSSGTHAECTVGSGKRVNEVIAWAKARNFKLFMGEMGATGQTQCGIEYRDMVSRMESSGVFIAWTAWGGGLWWPPSYLFRTAPLDWPKTTQPPAHMKYLIEFAAK